MSVWTIEPRDPLIFRDGKPFNPTPGARAKSLPFPNPSTLAGAVRTRAGQEKNGQFTGNPKELLEKVGIRGPVLTNLQNPENWYFPAPADCVVLQPEGLNSEQKDKIGQRFWARPVKIDAAEVCVLPNDLQPVSLTPVHKEKPHGKAPRFWTWEKLQKWLLAPANDPAPLELKTLGISGLTAESRIHVKIDPNVQTAAKEMLFQTSGLEFAVLGEEEKKSKHLQQLEEFALLVDTDAPNLRPGVDFLGGERRMVNWKKSGKLPICPPEIRETILKQKSCRLVLATPALFENGYLPRLQGMPAKIVAAAVPRGTAVSGWDYTVKSKDGQKPSRRLAPAGSVYFLKLDGTAEAIGRFVDAVWMQNISDDAQDRRDGFGLALLGVWDGKFENLEVK